MSVNDLVCVTTKTLDRIVDIKIGTQIYSDHMPLIILINLGIKNKKEESLTILPK